MIRQAFRHPGALYTIEAHRRSHDVAYQTARADLMALADLGLLERRKGARAFVFAVPGDLPDRLGRIDSVVTPSPGASSLSLPLVQK